VARYVYPFTGTTLSGRGDPFLELHREMNRLFDDASRGIAGGGARDPTGMTLVSPRMDIHESKNALELTAELPGVSHDQLDLRIEGDVLTIRGEKRNQRHDKQAHVVERSCGSFQRSVQLPFAPDPEQVEASFDHGVLTVVLPKKGEQEKAHKIQVRGSKGGQKNIEGTATENPQKGAEAKTTAKK
jgi:HSP20 family protein